MKTFITLSLLLVSTQASAQVATPRLSLTVKTYSGVCGGDEQKWRGSGISFSHGQSTYILTSNHVVLAGKKEFCHHIENKSLGLRSAELIASDYGVGLALLKLSGKASPGTPDDSILFAHNVRVGEPVTTNAFPYELTSSALSSAQGQVVSINSNRHFFAHRMPMIELAGSHAEFGMSGGPIFGVSHQFGGILSHQALMMVAGKITRLVDYSYETETGKVFNQVFVIPNSVIRAWLANVLKFGKSFVPSLAAPAVVTPQSNDVLYTDGLKFTLIAKNDSSGIGGEGAGHGTGVGGEGGAHGTGVGGEGGAHGTGVGGDGSSSVISSDEPKTIQVEISDLADLNGNFFQAKGQQKVSAKMKEALQRGNRVTLSILVKTTDTGSAGVYIYSLNQFFRYLAEGSYRAVIEANPELVQKSSTEINPENLASGKIQRLVNSTATAMKNLRASQKLKPQTQALLNQIFLQLKMVKSTDWKEVNPKTIAALADVYGVHQTEWAELIDQSRVDSIELLQVLTQLKEELTKLIR